MDYDVFVGGASGQAGGVFLNNGRGDFVRTQQSTLSSLVVELLEKPYEDADGDQDLFVTSGGFNHNQVIFSRSTPS